MQRVSFAACPLPTPLVLELEMEVIIICLPTSLPPEPSHLIELLFETPQFVNSPGFREAFDVDALETHGSADIAQILPLFTALEFWKVSCLQAGIISRGG